MSEFHYQPGPEPDTHHLKRETDREIGRSLEVVASMIGFTEMNPTDPYYLVEKLEGAAHERTYGIREFTDESGQPLTREQVAEKLAANPRPKVELTLIKQRTSNQDYNVYAARFKPVITS